MPKVLWLLALLCLPGITFSQRKPAVVKEKNTFTDSVTANFLKEDQLYDLPVITLTESDRSDHTMVFVPSVLSANRDVLLTAAAFHFSAVRFRLRGYRSADFSTHINGMSMNNPDDGATQWGLWSGLNDASRNAQTIATLQTSEHGFGNLGNLVFIDMRASKQRTQTQTGYAFSNRAATHKWSVMKSTAMNKNGWAISFAGSVRSTNEGYFSGTMYAGGSYYLAIDKRIGEQHLLSVILFGSSVTSGRQGAVVKESIELAGTSLYNPYWGYQAGKKRNANISSSHQPVLIVTDAQRMNNHTTLTTTLGVVTGEKSTTALDWYHAADPRPDYYRYLPGYQSDSLLRLAVFTAMQEEETLRQINWDRLYEINRNSAATIQNVNGIAGLTHTGNRSYYILEERVNQIKRLHFSTVLNTRLKENISITAGVSLQWQHSRYYKRINDLLGGDFYLDLNQFAEDNTGTDADQIQNNLSQPNAILTTGDTYGYDYSVKTFVSKGFVQLSVARKKTDFFAAAEISHTRFFREGNRQNGLFRFQSLGKSPVDVFTNLAVKAGATYKINGRKYAYLQGAIITKAPLFDNVYISPRTRDTRQDIVKSELITTIEAGYIMNSPSLKMRLTGYLTTFTNGMNVMTFYHDAYRNFVNYALTGMGTMHAGVELGTDYKVSSRLTATVAASVGRYYYNSRPQLSVTADNDAFVLENGLVYAKNFRVEGTPQEAYALGLSYQTETGLYINLSGNYFRQQWLAWNPVRRTYPVLENVMEGSEQWNRIIDQIALPDQYTVDFSAGKSLKIKIFNAKHRQTLVCNLSINNLLNKKDLISGGYEQLRFDTDTKNTEKFPPKYYYAMGLNYSFSISLRF